MPLRDHVHAYLAWKSIVDDADRLNLDKHHEREAKKSRDEAGNRVDGSITEAYRTLLVPMQDAEADGGLSKIVWEDETLALSGSTYDKAIEIAARDHEWVIRAWAPTHLAALLGKWFWKDGRRVALANKVWLDTCRYLYLPRILSAEVFLKTVEDGVVVKDYFGYAAAEKGTTFEGLVFGTKSGVYLTDTAVLIGPDVAGAVVVKPPKEEGEIVCPPPEEPEGQLSLDPTQPTTKLKKPSARPPGQVMRRFHGTINIDVPDPIGHFTRIVENVIEKFSSQYGTEVSVTVDIEARRKDGFDAKTVRNVREDAVQLKFRTAEFEEE